MGAAAEVADLARLREELHVNMAEKVPTRDGQRSLVEVFARAGRTEALAYVLDSGADLWRLVSGCGSSWFSCGSSWFLAVASSGCGTFCVNWGRGGTWGGGRNPKVTG